MLRFGDVGLYARPRFPPPVFALLFVDAAAGAGAGVAGALAADLAGASATFSWTGAGAAGGCAALAPPV